MLRFVTSSFSKGFVWYRYHSTELLHSYFDNFICIMTSSNGNIFRVTGPLCGEFTGHQWILITNASDAELWCFLWPVPWLNGWVNNREAGDLRRNRAHCDVIVMDYRSACESAVNMGESKKYWTPCSTQQCNDPCVYRQNSGINQTKSTKLECFATRVAVVFAQSIESTY